MARNMCPNCSHITLSIDEAKEIACPLCETVFGIVNLQEKYRNIFEKDSLIIRSLTDYV